MVELSTTALDPQDDRTLAPSNSLDESDLMLEVTLSRENLCSSLLPRCPDNSVGVP
jgi:hypothetical protein